MIGRTAKAMILSGVMLFAAQQASALPVFQVYVDGGVAGTWGGDEDTWFVTAGSFDLKIVSSFDKKVTLLDDITLVLSVPEGQQGTISISPSGSLITAGATEDVLVGGAALDGYDAKSQFLPDGVTFNDHYPFKDDVSDFVLFDLGSIARPDGTTTLNNYNAEDDTITSESAVGREDTYHVSFSGFDRVHLDVYGRQVTDLTKNSSWAISPNSHDSVIQYVPLPPAVWGGMVLLGGLGVARYLRKRRSA